MSSACFTYYSEPVCCRKSEPCSRTAVPSTLLSVLFVVIHSSTFETHQDGMPERRSLKMPVNGDFKLTSWPAVASLAEQAGRRGSSSRTGRLTINNYGRQASGWNQSINHPTGWLLGCLTLYRKTCLSFIPKQTWVDPVCRLMTGKVSRLMIKG